MLLFLYHKILFPSPLPPSLSVLSGGKKKNPSCLDQDLVKSLVGVVCSCHAHQVRVLALRAIRQEEE
jgi:hypothetical protein